MIDPDDLLEALVPTVPETDGMVYVWALVPRGHEIYHRGAYRLLEEIQPKEGIEVYLQLHGPVREREVRTIHEATGEISVARSTIKTGPVLIRKTSDLVRARLTGDTAPATLTIPDPKA